MRYTLGQAATATGKSKSTIQRAIENSRISAEKNDNGHYSIDPSELHRVYPPVASATVAKTVAQNDTQPQTQQTERIEDNAILEEKIALREEKLRLYEKQIEELREDRDEWKEQAKRLALTYQPRQETPEKATETQEVSEIGKRRQEGNNSLLWAFIAVLACVLGVVVTLLVQKDAINLGSLFSIMAG